MILSSIYLTKINISALDKISGLVSPESWKVYNSSVSKINIQNNESNNNIKDKKVVNLSSEVYIVSLNIAKLSIIEKPFGYGINNYHLAFNKYINEIETTNEITKRLNVFDASNNFAKLITELGIFSIIIFIIICYFLVSKNISYEYKFLIFPTLFTQTFVRGAGYFNGGYIFFLVIACYIIFKSTKRGQI